MPHLQKGIHLIEHAVHRTVELGGQFVVLGTGHADIGLRGLAGGHFRWVGLGHGRLELAGLGAARLLAAGVAGWAVESGPPRLAHTPCAVTCVFPPRQLDVQTRLCHSRLILPRAAAPFRSSLHSYRDNPDVQMRFMYSEALAHQIYAAADMLLVPSMFEPCGLTQVGRLLALLAAPLLVLLPGWPGWGPPCLRPAASPR